MPLAMPRDLIQVELFTVRCRKNSKRANIYVGLIGLEPMTLRLSSACSNQLSYRPEGNPKAKAQRQKSALYFMLFCGGKGIRTPDIQLAKLALYQLSYTPGRVSDGKV